MSETMVNGTPVIGRATLSDVAKLAGVSLKTASRALSGEKYVAAATRAAVVSAAKDLGYRRNAAASLLASRKPSESIGLIVGEMANPFYSGIAEGLDLALPGMHLIIAHTAESTKREWLLAQQLAEAQVQAIVIASSMKDHSCYGALQERGITLVFVDRPAINLDADCVLLDNRQAGLLAGRHLIGHGHRRIGIVMDYGWLPPQQERLAGMRQAFDEASVAFPEDLVRFDAHDADTARAQAASLMSLADPPTAYVGGNNRIVLGLLSEFTAQSRSSSTWPAVLGFDDFEWAPLLRLSVLANDPRDLGRQAGKLINSRLNRLGHASSTVVLPVDLIERGSAERSPSLPNG